jgi:hypothetical protein
LKFCPYSSTSAANGNSNSSNGKGSGSTKKNGAIMGTVPGTDALAIVAMTAILGAMAVTL